MASAETVRRAIIAVLRTPQIVLRHVSSKPSPFRSRSKTPTETHFEKWVQILKPGFTPGDVIRALESQLDPDLAVDIFRWTGQQRSYTHTPETYHTILRIAASARRRKTTESLVEEILAGVCPPTLPLYNTVIRVCSSQGGHLGRAFDAFKKMTSSTEAKPDLETFTTLFSALLRRFARSDTACHVYLRSVRSLARQMKAMGVSPDTYVLNMIVRAYSECGHVDEAIEVYKDMGVQGCRPNAHTHGVIARALCEKGRVSQGFWFHQQMRKTGMIPKGPGFMVVICSLAMEARLEEAVEAAFDMLRCGMSPDLLTYKTVLEEICRAGKDDRASRLLEEFRRKDPRLGSRDYQTLLDRLHLIKDDV